MGLRRCNGDDGDCETADRRAIRASGERTERVTHAVDALMVHLEYQARKLGGPCVRWAEGTN